MSPANGHAKGAAVNQPSETTGPLAAEVLDLPATSPSPSQKLRELFKELVVPFDSSVIEWRVTNTTKDKTRGQVIPYADQRAYTDRLNALVTPAGWTRKYAIHTSANFQRGNDQRTVAKIFVTCELTIFGLGSHPARERSGRTTTMQVRAPKRRLSSEPAPALGSGVISITLLGLGWISMTSTGLRLSRNWPAGQRLKNGGGV